MNIDLKSITSLLLATVTVVTFAKAMHIGFIFRPVFELWRRSGKIDMAFIVVIVAVFAVYAVSKEGPGKLAQQTVPPPLGMSPGADALPGWYVSLGYPVQDTDGDGIPDCWERWTRTNPGEYDANQDPDGDGVDNLDEFRNQCDPMFHDTDGDGYSDFEEINGMSSGRTWFNPIIAANYEVEETDLDGNGVPDRWEGTGYPYGYVDDDSDGLCDNVPFTPVADGSVDIVVTVTTTRPALLTWNGEANNGYVVQPCTNLAMRLRLPVDDVTDVRLLGAMPDSTAPGLWYSTMDAAWPDDNGLDSEGERVRLDPHTVVDLVREVDTYIGEIDGEMAPPTIHLVKRGMWLDIGECSCWEHGGQLTLVESFTTNVVPAFAWHVNGREIVGAASNVVTAAQVHDFWDGLDPIVVTCMAVETNGCERIRLEVSDTVELDHCPPSVTNIVGAAWTSTHNPTNAADHVPSPKVENVYRHSEYCPLTHEATYYVGWEHYKVNTRNLPVIQTDDPRDGETDHCLALEWSPGMTIDLAEYLTADSLDVIGDLRFKVNGDECLGVFDGIIEPREMNPTVYYVEVLSNGSVMLDAIWITVYTGSDKSSFDRWVSIQTTNLDWTASLPLPPTKLTMSEGEASIDDDNWSSPTTFNRSYMHHNAVFEIRTETTSVHGNQATYDDIGNIIVSGIAAGTADLYAPYNSWGLPRLDTCHRDYDVYPYLKALQLDGNPVSPRWLKMPTGLNRPCLFEGTSVGRYLHCRPTVYKESTP